MARYVFDPEFEAYFIKVCEASVSMSQAALKLGMNYKTVRFHAKRLNCFKNNQAGRNILKPKTGYIIPLSQIFCGAHKTYQTQKLKNRLLKEGFKVYQCEACALKLWQGVPIPLELHHVDGNRMNNALENLKLLCPNCHALTANYRARNIGNLSASVEMQGVEPLKFGEA